MPKMLRIWNDDRTLYNHRHELFCQHLTMGCTIRAAYISAGYKESQGCHANALKLMKHAEIQQRLEDLRKEQSEMYKLTKGRIIEELGKVVMGEKTRDSDKVKACNVIAKMMGFHAAKEAKVTVSTDSNTLSDEELEAMLLKPDTDSD